MPSGYYSADREYCVENDTWVMDVHLDNDRIDCHPTTVMKIAATSPLLFKK
jgi:hypothetical protein